MTAPLGNQYIRDQKIPLVSIGPTTTRAIVDAGHEVAREAAPHSAAGVLSAICDLLCPEGTNADDAAETDANGDSANPEEEA